MAGSQGAFLGAVDEHLDTVLLRAHGRESVRAVAWVLASTASWADLTARPTWEVLQVRTGRSRSTVAYWLAWLTERGLIGVVESGTTPRFAPMALSQGAPNRAAVYVLCVPQTQLEASTEPKAAESVEESRTPTVLVLDLKKDPYPRPRASRRRTDVGPLRGRESRSEKQGRPAWPRTAVARSRAERLALADRLQECAPTLRAMSTLALRSVLRPWLERPELGWTVAWLMHAIDTTPHGEARTWTTPVRAPAGWLRFRLSAWLDEHGHPLPSPGVALAAAAQTRRDHAEQTRRDQDERTRLAQAEHEFGQLIRDVAGERYPALVEAVVGRQPGARLMPAAAAEALTRLAVRARIGAHSNTDGTTLRLAVATAIGQLLES